MDRQEIQQLVDKLKRRFSRELPEPVLIYGRRAVKAPGFSLAELTDAGLDEASAVELGIKVDRQRMNSIGSNVDALLEFLKR